jgi:hypothetical protein
MTNLAAPTVAGETGRSRTPARAKTSRVRKPTLVGNKTTMKTRVTTNTGHGEPAIRFIETESTMETTYTRCRHPTTARTFVAINVTNDPTMAEESTVSAESSISEENFSAEEYFDSEEYEHISEEPTIFYANVLSIETTYTRRSHKTTRKNACDDGYHRPGPIRRHPSCHRYRPY